MRSIETQRKLNLLMELKWFMVIRSPEKFLTAHNNLILEINNILEENPDAPESEIDKALVMFCDFIANPDKVPGIENN